MLSDTCTNPKSAWESLEDPQTAGWNVAGLDTLREVADSDVTDCLMVVQHGKVVFTYGDLTHNYQCHSMRKSFLAALMGEDVQRGIIDPTATLADLGIDDKDGLSEVEKHATVYDLMTARSGIYHAAGYETEWMKMIKEKRHSHAPGTFWCYNNWDFNALGTIFTKLTGISVAEAFDQRIARPLGMEDFSLEGPEPDGWTESFDESVHKAYPFRMTSRDLARFGQMFLQGGRWNNQFVLPEGWAEENVMPYSHAGARGAYGYMWWLERDGVFLPGVRTPSGSFAAQGAGGHYCMVVPPLDMVIIHRVDTDVDGTAISKHGFGKVLKAIFDAAPKQ